jgi:ABC-2 type transport system ATP-binding protein
MTSGPPIAPISEPVWAIHAESIIKRYKNARLTALNEFNLTVRQGEFYGLLGPNGAGKTTAISLFFGLLSPDSGSIRILGMDFQRQRTAIKQMLGLVPQELGLYDKLTARENLAFFAKISGVRAPALAQRIQEGLTFARLTDHRHQQVATFSTGMKRRLNLAVGLVGHPRLLILDEPCVGIDAQSRNLIHEQLQALNRQGTTIFYTTHYMEEAQELCTRVGIIDNGRLVEEGAPADLLRQSDKRNLEELFIHLTGKGLRDQQ